MEAEAIRVLLSLCRQNQERSKIDPGQQLAVLYRESMEMRKAAVSTEKMREKLSLAYRERQAEQERLIRDKPEQVKEIENAREKLLRQQGMSLKEMLEIREKVVRLEEAIYYGEARVQELQEMLACYAARNRELSAKGKELRVQYNRHAEVYNREKANAERILAAFRAGEDALLAMLPEGLKDTYKRALRKNPDNPIVRIAGEACGGCRIGLSRQTLKTVRLEGTAFCENCLRILLPAREEEKEEKPALG